MAEEQAPHALDEAIVLLGRKVKGYEEALAAAGEELDLVERALDEQAESRGEMLNLAKRCTQIEAEIRMLKGGLAEAEFHVRFLLRKRSTSDSGSVDQQPSASVPGDA